MSQNLIDNGVKLIQPKRRGHAGLRVNKREKDRVRNQETSSIQKKENTGRWSCIVCIWVGLEWLCEESMWIGTGRQLGA